MPVHTSEMNIGAKQQHHVSTLIDLDVTARNWGPTLYDDENRIAIEDIYYEVHTALASSTATIKIGNASDDDAYGIITVDTSAAGTFIDATLYDARKDIPAGTKVLVSHVDAGTVEGDGFVHIDYYRKNEANKQNI